MSGSDIIPRVVLKILCAWTEKEPIVVQFKRHCGCLAEEILMRKSLV